tara:strand:- start:294 stop:485 length:192 start_codon:yes stop_codon:yes gene_type:complete
MFQIHWDNGHASGVFPQTFYEYSEAQEFAKEWLVGMISLEASQESQEQARSDYHYDIFEVSGR